MAADLDALGHRLGLAFVRHLGESIGSAAEVRDLQRLTAGAANETWRFDVIAEDQRFACILRRSPADPTLAQEPDPDARTSLTKGDEARVQQAARDAGVPAAQVLFILEEEDDLGVGYVMERLSGETIPRRILRDDEYAGVRGQLARQCGGILAQLHQVDTVGLPALNPMAAREQIDRYGELYRSFGQAVGVFEIALRWLEDHLRMPQRTTLVHGDFRNGNLMIGPDGVRAVLDWELTHLGDPMEDLGWICVTSWRFGEIDLPVGGFGTREELFAGYEEAGGGRVDPEAVRYWEVFGTLKWGIMCMIMTHGHLSGVTRSVEKAAIGRRVSETELDLLNLLAPRAGH